VSPVTGKTSGPTRVFTRPSRGGSRARRLVIAERPWIIRPGGAYRATVSSRGGFAGVHFCMALVTGRGIVLAVGYGPLPSCSPVRHVCDLTHVVVGFRRFRRVDGGPLARPDIRAPPPCQPAPTCAFRPER
jgi:hypothetical protein